MSTRFENPTIALEAQFDYFSIEDLQARIYEEDLRQKRDNDNNVKALPLQTTEHKNTYSSNKIRGPLTCFRYKKNGHKIADYHKRKRKSNLVKIIRMCLDLIRLYSKIQKRTSQAGW